MSSQKIFGFSPVFVLQISLLACRFLGIPATSTISTQHFICAIHFLRKFSSLLLKSFRFRTKFDIFSETFSKHIPAIRPSVFAHTGISFVFPYRLVFEKRSCALLHILIFSQTSSRKPELFHRKNAMQVHSVIVFYLTPNRVHISTRMTLSVVTLALSMPASARRRACSLALCV